MSGGAWNPSAQAQSMDHEIMNSASANTENSSSTAGSSHQSSVQPERHTANTFHHVGPLNEPQLSPPGVQSQSTYPYAELDWLLCTAVDPYDPRCSRLRECLQRSFGFLSDHSPAQFWCAVASKPGVEAVRGGRFRAVAVAMRNAYLVDELEAIRREQSAIAEAGQHYVALQRQGGETARRAGAERQARQDALLVRAEWLKSMVEEVALWSLPREVCAWYQGIFGAQT